jgi:hypothetical protein
MVEEHIKKESFVTRIWLEHGNNGDPEWRGYIRHVQGEEEGYFQNLMEMRDFLVRVSGVAGPALTAQPLRDVSKLPPGAVTDMKNDED